MSAATRMSTQELINAGASAQVVTRSMMIEHYGSTEAADLHLAEQRMAAARRWLDECVEIAKGYRSSPGWSHLSGIDRALRLEQAIRGVANALVAWKHRRAERDLWQARVDALDGMTAPRRVPFVAAAE